MRQSLYQSVMRIGQKMWIFFIDGKFLKVSWFFSQTLYQKFVYTSGAEMFGGKLISDPSKQTSILS